MQIILASTSPYRKQLLERLGITFTCLAPSCEESVLKHALHAQQADAAQIATSLARAKAASIAALYPQALVIGSDQVAHFAGEILDKPGSIDHACAQLERMNGQQHELLTAVCIIHNGHSIEHLERCTLTMAKHSSAALRAYVERDNAIDCAGSYKLEAAGISLFTAIDAADHSAITGLPLLYVAGILRQHGISIPAAPAAL